MFCSKPLCLAICQKSCNSPPTPTSARFSSLLRSYPAHIILSAGYVTIAAQKWHKTSFGGLSTKLSAHVWGKEGIFDALLKYFEAYQGYAICMNDEFIQKRCLPLHHSTMLSKIYEWRFSKKILEIWKNGLKMSLFCCKNSFSLRLQKRTNIFSKT